MRFHHPTDCFLFKLKTAKLKFPTLVDNNTVMSALILYWLLKRRDVDFYKTIISLIFSTLSISE